MHTNELASKTILIAGASSASGVAVARALAERGAVLIVVGSNRQRLDERLGFAAGRYECDLAQPLEVEELAQKVRTEFGPIDGLLHFVGGWRGGKGITGQTDEDWDFLHTGVMTTLRNTTRAFYDQLLAAPAGRLAIISSQAVQNPTPSNANYGAVKAAAEFWVQAIARAFSKQAPQAAAAIWVVKALTEQRPQGPGSKLSGFTHVEAVAQAAVELFTADAPSLNGQRLELPSFI